MTPEMWIHVVEIVVLGLGIPVMKAGISAILSLNRATDRLSTVTVALQKSLDDHEARLRDLEYVGLGGIERRKPRESRSEDKD